MIGELSTLNLYKRIPLGKSGQEKIQSKPAKKTNKQMRRKKKFNHMTSNQYPYLISIVPINDSTSLLAQIQFMEMDSVFKSLVT